MPIAHILSYLAEKLKNCWIWQFLKNLWSGGRRKLIFLKAFSGSLDLITIIFGGFMHGSEKRFIFVLSMLWHHIAILGAKPLALVDRANRNSILSDDNDDCDEELTSSDEEEVDELVEWIPPDVMTAKVIVTDVTVDDFTVTLRESERPEGFFGQSCWIFCWQSDYRTYWRWSWCFLVMSSAYYDRTCLWSADIFTSVWKENFLYL